MIITAQPCAAAWWLQHCAPACLLSGHGCADTNLVYRRQLSLSLQSHETVCLSQDLRSDRQPEFTQLDMEMAFMDQADIVALTERLIAAVFREVGRSHT